MNYRPQVRGVVPGRMRIAQWLLAGGLAAAPPGAGQPATIDFNREVRPILERCTVCHGGVHRRAGLSLLFGDAALQPTDSGSRAIVPGDPTASLLLQRVVDADQPMPPKGERLDAQQVLTLRRWIAQGAGYEPHWAYVPPPPIAPSSDNSIDRWVQAGLEREGLARNKPAPREQWLRRVSIDLTGLPPTLAELDAFASDQAADAFDRVVDRLLASPHYGERLAALWLDLARYADTKGYEKDMSRPMWLYRDWLIEAFNRDLPFDRFTVEQLAGDLLQDADVDSRIATAFHRNTMTNDEGGTDDEEFRTAAVIDRLNTTFEVWLGTSFGCAQCHNHPYDPFTQVDYYRALAFFNNTADADRDDEAPLLRTTARRADRERQAQLERDLAEVAQQRAALLASDGPIDAAFQPLAIRAASAAHGTVLTAAGAGTLIAGGDNPPTERITLEGVARGSITALRIDLLPDAAFASGGVGRGRDGNCVLTDCELSVRVEDAQATPHQGRFVRVELYGADRILHLAEVEALDASGTNLALGAHARQSSIAYHAPALRAVDGNTDGDFEHGSVTHTATQTDPWLEIDLGREVELRQIALWNRSDGDGGLAHRLDGVRVRLLDSGRHTVFSRAAARADDPVLRFDLDPRERQAAWWRAEADHSQPGYDVAQVLRNPRHDAAGWAVGPHMATPHHAILRLERALAIPAGAQVRVVLHHAHTHGGNYAGAGFGRFAIALCDDPAWLPPGGIDAHLALEQREQHLRTELAQIRTATLPILQELPPAAARRTHRFERGNWLAPAEEVTPDVPASLPPLPPDAPRDRLGFARWLVSGEHPLTARVAVNRLWEALFGHGLVATLEDFGTQGDRPSHPELLDALALRFQGEYRWSIKRLLREIVLSTTYRQDHAADAAQIGADPHNRRLARGPRNRLTAEQVRDCALAVAGLLSHRLGGPSVMPPQPDGIWASVYNGETWNTPTDDDHLRRALYTFWKRTSPYPSMTTFDAPSREFCVSRRIATNTPLQALVTLNDPVYLECARALAAAMAEPPHSDSAMADLKARLARAFRRVTSRPPTDDELATLRALYDDALADFRAHSADAKRFGGDPERAALVLVANVLLNLDEALVR